MKTRAGGNNKILAIAIVVALITALVLIKPDVFLDKIFVSPDNSYLLVDDFSATERNCLGGNSSLFVTTHPLQIYCG
jgi:hypothetical protein